MKKSILILSLLICLSFDSFSQSAAARITASAATVRDTFINKILSVDSRPGVMDQIRTLDMDSVRLKSFQITRALGFTPYNATNPNSYVNKAQTDTYYRHISYVPAYSDVTGRPLYYNSSGAITSQIKKWIGVVTASTASGQSINISSAGFSSILSVQVTALQNSSNQNGALVSVKSASTTALTANIYKSKTTGVLLGGNIDGLELHDAPSSVTLYVEVTGL